jgi:O-antigen ligase
MSKSKYVAHPIIYFSLCGLMLSDTLRFFSIQRYFSVSLVVIIVILGFSAPKITQTKSSNYFQLGFWLTYFLFLTCALVYLLIKPSYSGSQNILIYFGFIFLIWATSNIEKIGDLTRVQDLFWKFASISALISLINFLQFGVNQSGVASTRSLAACCLIGIIAISFRYNQGSNDFIISLFLFMGVFFTYSRTPIVLALPFVIYAFFKRTDSNFKRFIGIFSFLTLLPLIFSSYLQDFLARFVGGDNQRIAGYAFNSSGRFKVWDAVLKNFQESFLFGNGPGNSVEFMTSYFTISHPHNDYLRILNDFGIFGFLIFFCPLLYTGLRIYRALKPLAHSPDKSFLKMTLSLLLTFLVGFFFDNWLIIYFLMFPLGVAIGISIQIIRKNQ